MSRARIAALALVVVVVAAIAAGVAVGVGSSNAVRIRRQGTGVEWRRPCTRPRQGARQRLGARRDHDRPVVDDERGQRPEHALFGRRAQAGARGERARRADRDRRLRRFRVPRHGAAASPTRPGSSTPARTGRSASGRRRSRTSGRLRPRSRSTTEPRRPSFAGWPSTVTASTRPTFTTDASMSSTATGSGFSCRARSPIPPSHRGTRPTTSSCSAATCSSPTSGARPSTGTTIRPAATSTSSTSPGGWSRGSAAWAC